MKKINQRLLLVLNEDYHSPLTLCAAGLRSVKGTDEEADKARDMLEFLISEMKSLSWSFGPVQSSLLDLEGIAFSYNHKRYENSASKPLPLTSRRHMCGAIDWICISDATRSITIPDLVKVIKAKWSRVSANLFLFRFYLHLILTSCITMLSCFVNITPTLNWTKPAELIVTILYPFTAIMLCLEAVLELPLLLRYGFGYWGLTAKHIIRGAAKFDKILFTVIFVSFYALFVQKCLAYLYQDINVYTSMSPSQMPTIAPTVSGNFSRAQPLPFDGHLDYLPLDSIGMKLSLAICVLSVWTKVFYFLMAFESTGPFVLTIYRIVSKDVPYFLTFYLVILVAFGCALSMLTNNGSYHVGWGFWALLDAIWGLIKTTVNLPLPAGDDILNGSVVPIDEFWVYDVISTLYNVIANLMMVNLLIAMISNTFNMLTDSNESLLLIEKCNIMCSLEHSFLAFEKQVPYSWISSWIGFSAANMPTKYAIKVNHTINKEQIISDDAADLSEGFESYAFEIVENVENWELGESSEVQAAKNKLRKIVLLIIDPQIDFHEEGGEKGTDSYHPLGSLAVPGANADSERVANMINSNIDSINDIFITMDSHFSTHIAHQMCWRSGIPCKAGAPCSEWCVPGVGCPPQPFTAITHDDVKKGRWVYVLPDKDGKVGKESKENTEWVEQYTKELERKVLVIVLYLCLF